MATFQKGKGTGKRVVTLTQLGPLLTKDELSGVSRMLTGYRRLPSPEAAQTELLRQSLELIAAGLAPVDAAAQAIAAEAPKRSSSGESSTRRDLYVENEATGLMLTSRRMAGSTLEEGSPQWLKAVKKGDILPLELVQDDPFIMRVVVGGELQQAEQEEWVARVDSHLNVKDGKLCVTGGAVLCSADFEADDCNTERYIREIDIPKGHYRATLYSYLPGVNGTAPLDELAGGYGRAEPIGRWFRRTRTGETLPAWLREWCIGDAALDPGHEAEWKGQKLPAECAAPDFVHFLVHLEPVKSAPKDNLSELSESGWFDFTLNARVPERCPLGLAARGIERQPAASGSWIFAQHAFELCAAREVRTLDGGPVSLPLAEIALCFQLAWFRTRIALPGMRATLPPGANVGLNASLPDGVLVAPNGTQLDFIFSNDLEPRHVIDAAAGLFEFLLTLPAGTRLELCMAPPSDLPGTDPEAGTSRFQGELHDGCLQLSSTFPATNAASLSSALQLARESLAGERIGVSDVDEGKAILTRANRLYSYMVEDNPGTLRGSAIELSKPDRITLGFYAAAAFSIRFKTSWAARSFLVRDDD